MRALSLVFWFFMVTVLAIAIHTYRQAIYDWYCRIRQQEGMEGKPIFAHPSFQWPLRIFLVITVLAWIDLVAWGISSVLPLALFILIFGGFQGLRKSAHLLLILSAFWVICRLLFGQSPQDFINQLDLTYLCQVYGVKPATMSPLVIPLVVLFFVGVSTLIWREHVSWGIGAILVSTCIPFVIGFLFGGKAQGAGSGVAEFLSKFYGVSDLVIRYLIVPQSALIICGIFLISRKKVFSGLVWLGIGLILPFGVNPARELYGMFSSGSKDKSVMENMALFYNLPMGIFKVVLLLQIALLASSFLLAWRKAPVAGFFLFFAGILLPWFVLLGNQAVQQHILPAWKEGTLDLKSIAGFYNRPEVLVRTLFIPMIASAILGFSLLVFARKPIAGTLFLILALMLPWLSEPVQVIYAELNKARVEGIAGFYHKPTASLTTLLLPMSIFFLFGVLAMFQKRMFWGGVMILGSLCLPWFADVIGAAFSNLFTYPEYNYGLLASYYKLDGASLALYVPGMGIMLLLGLYQLTVREREFSAAFWISTAIYLPLLLPFVIQNFFK